MVEITKETWEQNGVEVIASGGKKWPNEKHKETQLGHANLPAIILQYPPNLRNKDKTYKVVAKTNLVKDF